MISASNLPETGPDTAQLQKLRVLLVEDHLVLREGLVKLLEQSDEVVVAATAANAEEALEKLSEELQLVILDLSLPGRDGIWLAAEIKKQRPDLPILVLTMHEQTDFIVKALRSGVDGYLTKCAGHQELLRAIRAVVESGSYLQARLAPIVIDALRRRDTVRQVKFSEREERIARCLVRGLSNAEIAGLFRLSVSTIKSDLRSLYAKLKVTGRTEAVAVVVSKGLVS